MAAHRLSPKLLLLLLSLALGCAPGARGLVREGTPDAVNLAKARGRDKAAQAFAWRPFEPASFEEAKRDRKLIVLDGAASWCHWCHVMDETTYLDPEVGALLREHFVAIRVDIDAHPDVAERYGEWGWPATIVMTPDAEELGKYRGYLPPEELRDILRRAKALRDGPAPSPAQSLADAPPPVAALGWIAGRTLLDMDDYYDPGEGGWGRRQKAPIGANVEVELRRAARGDAAARARAVFTLQKQRALLDPVWGGVYQYSAGRSWNEPHYEKLMPYQTANLIAYARAFALTRDPSLLADAQRIAGYLSTFLSNAEGAFLVSQDADVGAHDPNVPFIDGAVYYPLGDAGRRALGVPRVDDHVYPHENGLAIAALAALFEAARDERDLMRARRAADLMIARFVTDRGEVKRRESGPRYLIDAAALGLGLAALALVAGDPTYKDKALRIGANIQVDFGDNNAPSLGLYVSSPNPAATGALAARQRAFPHNVMAARLFAVLHRITGDIAWKDKGLATLASVMTPRALASQGRMLGDLLLALDDLGVSF